LRSILRRVWERAFVLEHLAEITAIDPTAAGRAANEVLGLVRRRLSDALADIFTARDAHLPIALMSSCAS